MIRKFGIIQGYLAGSTNTVLACTFQIPSTETLLLKSLYCRAAVDDDISNISLVVNGNLTRFGVVEPIIPNLVTAPSVGANDSDAWGLVFGLMLQPYEFKSRIELLPNLEYEFIVELNYPATTGGGNARVQAILEFDEAFNDSDNLLRLIRQ